MNLLIKALHFWSDLLAGIHIHVCKISKKYCDFFPIPNCLKCSNSSLQRQFAKDSKRGSLQERNKKRTNERFPFDSIVCLSLCVVMCSWEYTFFWCVSGGFLFYMFLCVRLFCLCAWFYRVSVFVLLCSCVPFWPVSGGFLICVFLACASLLCVRALVHWMPRVVEPLPPSVVRPVPGRAPGAGTYS